MKKSICIIAILYLFSRPLYTAEPKKPSMFSKFKGFFGKKKEEPKKELAESNNLWGAIYHILGDLQTLYKNSYESIEFLKIKVTTIDAVKKELLKIHTDNDKIIQKQISLIKQRNEKILSESDEKELTKATEQLKKMGEPLAQLNGQLGRLRADALSTFVDVLKEVRPLMVHIQQLLGHAGYTTEQNPVKQWLLLCDQVTNSGNDIVEQLLLKSKAYGKQSSFTPKEQKVAIESYLKTVLVLSENYKRTIDTVKGIMQKIHTVGSIANKITFGYFSYVETVPKMLNEIIGLCSHIMNFAAEIGKVTESSQIKIEEEKLKQEEKKLKQEVSNAEKTWQSYLSGLAKWIPLIG